MPQPAENFMRTGLFFFLTALLVFILNLSGYCQEFPFIHFPNQYISSGEVFAIQQNQNKETIFVTREGVFSFNSRQTHKIFRFSQEEAAGLSQALFTSGKLLVLSNGSMLRLDPENGKSESVNAGKGLTEKIFYHPAKDEIYLFSAGALKLLKEGGGTETIAEGLTDIQAVFFGEQEKILIGKNKVYIYPAGNDPVQILRTGENIIDSYYSNGRLILLSPNFIYSREDAGALKKEYKITEEHPLCILEDQTGKIWVGTGNHGLILYDGRQNKSLGFENGFPLREVKGIYQSQDLSVWFYGNGGLVLRPFSAPFLKFEAGKHLPGKKIDDIWAADSGKTAVITRGGFFCHLEHETVQDSVPLNLPFAPDFSKITGDDQSLHLNKRGQLFYRDKQRSYSASLNTEVKRLFSFRNISLILGRDGKEYSFSHNSKKIKPLSLGISVEGPVFQDEKSLVFAGSDGSLRRWDSKTGSLENIENSNFSDSFIALSDKNYLFALRSGGTLKYLFDGIIYETDFSLSENEKVTGFVLSASALWISTDENLYQIGLSSLEERSLILKKVEVFNAAGYGLELPVLKCIENEEGGFWLATKNNIFLYNSLAMAPDVSPPGFVLERVSVQHKDSLTGIHFSVKDSVRVNLKTDEHLIISAFAVNYGSLNKASLKYRLPVAGGAWRDPAQEGLILISDLAPGNHVLEVSSENGQGLKSKKSAFFLIGVRNAGWNKWYVAAGASFGLVLAGFVAFIGFRPGRDAKSREAREKYEKELLKLQKRSHEQMLKADGLKQVNELITAQKQELEEKNKQIIAQKYELSLTNNQIKQQKNLIEKTTDKLESSINYAQKIQTALMGDEILIKEDLPESFVFFKPKDQVSGDFFWFDKTENEQGEKLLILAAVDCTGHGVPGAIVSVVGIQLLNAIVNAKKIYDPGKILTELNNDLLQSLKYEQTRINDGMDMGLVTINLTQKKLLFSGAKNPVFYMEEGELQILKGDKMPIGGQKLKEEKIFVTHEVPLKGDGSQMFYLFTDGYQDQFGGPEQFKFLVKNFKELLKNMSSSSMMEQKYMLGKTLSEWQGNEEQTDDILVMGFRI